MDKPKVSLVKCTSYDTAQVETAVKRAVDLLGGVEQFIKPDEKVLIKPNLLMDATPEEGIDTHPEVVRAVIRSLKSVTKNIYCGDSPSVWGEHRDIDHVYEVAGMKKVCLDEGVELVYFTSPKMKGSYPLTDWLDKCDRLVSIPKFKTHGFTVLTAGIKNLFGLVIGMNKIKVHKDNPRPDDLSRALIDIYEIRRPDLTVLDGITAMEGQGPGHSGSLRPMNLIAASPDALALDIILSVLMGLSPDDIPTTKEAIRRGLGQGDLSSIEVFGENLKTFVTGDFKLPKTTFLNKVPKWIIDISKQFLKMEPTVLRKKCKICSLCVKGCPGEAIVIKNKHISIDPKKCILCLCCQEICPHGAVEIRKSFLLRMGVE